MKIATWNVNSLRVRLPQVLDWLAENPVDVLGIQETKMQDSEFPFEALREAGYLAVANGQKTYNGVALLSQALPQDVTTDIPGFDDAQKRVIAATYDGVRVVDVYVPNGQAVGSDKYAYKLDWLARLRDYLAGELERYPKLVVVGDYNIAPADADVHDPEAWRDQILCSEPERARLGELCALGLADCFRLFEQPEQSFSWWDYRAAGFRRNLGLRIDLLLASKALAQACTACTIDVAPRRNERPSDHTPVIAEFAD